MFEKLDELDDKLASLEGRLSDPALLANQNEYRKVAKDHSHLLKLSELYTMYKKVKGQIEDNRLLLRQEDDEELLDMVRSEIDSLTEKAAGIEAEIKIMLLPRDPNDDRNIFLEIRAGTGGDEAALFVGDLFKMYSRYAEQKNWNVEVMSSNPLGIGGFKEIIVLISGEQVFSFLKYESGTHRVQRVPETEAQGRVHTSAVTVAIIPEADDVEIEIDPGELRIDTYRASGSGGQHVNKTDSAIRITHLPTGLVVTCQDEKSQHKNKAKALKVLRARLFDKLHQDQQDKISADRKTQVGSGDRSERIRTYNYPQNRLTEHRINLTLYRLEDILMGHLDEVINPLIIHHQAEILKSIN